MSNTRHTQEEVNRINEFLHGLNGGQDYDARISIDEEFFILERNGETIHHDSACEDVYTVDGAMAMFESIIIDNESN